MLVALWAVSILLGWTIPFAGWLTASGKLERRANRVISECPCCASRVNVPPDPLGLSILIFQDCIVSFLRTNELKRILGVRAEIGYLADCGQ